MLGLTASRSMRDCCSCYKFLWSVNSSLIYFCETLWITVYSFFIARVINLCSNMVHPKDENSMAMSGLGCENPVGEPFSPLILSANGPRKHLSFS